MKKYLIALALATAGLSSVANVDFSIEGRILAKTCKVKTNYANLVVVLPTVSIASLGSSGKTNGYTRFPIELAECENTTVLSGKGLYAFFESDRVDANNNYTLQNAATANPARNVNVQLTNHEGSAIQVSNQSLSSGTFTPATGYSGKGLATIQANLDHYTLEYGAQYYATGRASAGLVESFATFSVQYK